jgi:sodium/proline symporter
VNFFGKDFVMEGNGIIIVELVIYLLAMLAIGVYFGRKELSQADYHMGGHRVSGWVLALSERATGESAWLILGLTGAAYAVGLPEVWVAIGCVSGVILSWLFLARKFRAEAKKYNAITYTGYITSKYPQHASFIRWFSSIILIFFYTLYVYAQFEGGGIILNRTFNLEPTMGIVISAVITILYSMAGGFLAVVWTDAVQAILMILTFIITPVIALIAVWSKDLSISAALAAGGPGMNSWSGTEVGLFVAGLFVLNQLSWGFGYLGGQPQLSTRWMAMNSDEDVKRGTWVAIIWTILAYGGAIMIGFCALALYGKGAVDNPEKILPHMLILMLPAWLVGILLVGAIAAMMSTASSQLLVITSCISEDIIHKVFHKKFSDRVLVNISRVAMVGVGAVALWLALVLGKPIFNVVGWAWAGIGCSFSPAIILSFYWKKCSGSGVVASLVSGFTVTVIWMTTGLYQTFSAMTATFFIAMLMSVIVSLLYPDRNDRPV